MVLGEHLALSRRCVHVKGHGGAKAAIRQIVQRLPTARFAVDLSFASFDDGAKRRYPAATKSGADAEDANPANQMVELRGIEPLTLRLPA